MTRNIPERFSDHEVKAILARAIEIDARDPQMTAADLREIATEVGVSQASLEAAIHERTSAVRVLRPAPPPLRVVTISALGVPLGVAAAWVLATGSGLGVLGLLTAGLIATGSLVLFQGSTGSLRTFHLRNLAFWGGVAVGGVALSLLADIGVGIGTSGLMGVAWGVRGWITSSILGSAAVIAIRRALRSRDIDADEGGPETTPAVTETRLTRVVRRVRNWFLAFNLRDSRVPDAPIISAGR